MARFYLNPNIKLGKINKEIQGHFSEHLGRCIYEGIYVGENSEIPNVNGMRCDVVNALKKIKIPVLRWPGGCFADEYHWLDGVGPKEKRKKMINTHWGGVVEDNSFGTHEYMELCSQLGCANYINGNFGSGTVREMSEWVEYMSLDGVSPMADLRKQNGREKAWKIDYFGIGNENWGCGGNMTAEYYANEYRRYQTYVRNYDSSHQIKKICCGPSNDDYEWTDKVMRIAGKFADGLSLHYYTIPHCWEHKGSALDFTTDEWYKTLKKTLVMDEIITNHSAIMNRYDPEKKVALIVDEWGTWYDCEPGTNPGFLYQQNTMRDALVAAINLNIFNKHCDRVKMANIAQLVNVLQSVILTEGEKMILTPTYFVFDLFSCHQEAELVWSSIEASSVGTDEDKVPNLCESASIDKDGIINITIANLSADESYKVETILCEAAAADVKGTILTGEIHAHNSFDKPNSVKTSEFNGAKITEKGIEFEIPACSVIKLAVKLA